MPQITFTCPTCDQELEAPEDFAGETVECPGCGAELTVPAASPASGRASQHAPVDEVDEDEEADNETEPSAEEGVCPECGAEMDPDTILCLGCGYHARLGRRIETNLDADE